MEKEIIEGIKKLDIFIKEDISNLNDIEFVVFSIVSKHKNTEIIQKIKDISIIRMYDLFADIFMIEYEDK
ncbi:MAG: hypothetical protein J6Y02_19490 [Pseudobutyrivibrio sp.]|nr:hypothetical protein [Pseudobutyrivibrio sp.]